MLRVSVILGRFQPVHLGHQKKLRDALDSSSHVIVVIGSAARARSIRNPFTWRERSEMIRSLFNYEENSRLHVLALRDFYDRYRWATTLAQMVNRCVCSLADVQIDTSIEYWGQFEDPLLAELPEFSNWTFRNSPRYLDIDGSLIRQKLFGSRGSLPITSGNLDSLTSEERSDQSSSDFKKLLPSGIENWLKKQVNSDYWTRLMTEAEKVQQMRNAWSFAPYPPIFVTVDSLVRCGDVVLLIRRKRAPGEGLWALPGGYINADEHLFKAALRELAEETTLTLSEETARSRLRGAGVFDHPQRSLVGRVITHAFYFDLGDAPPPPVQFADDAASAEWIPSIVLADMEAEFHDDHFFILDYFLNLLPE